MYTIDAAAKKLGVKPGAIYGHLTRGNLVKEEMAIAVLVDGKWRKTGEQRKYITKESLDRVLARNGGETKHNTGKEVFITKRGKTKQYESMQLAANALDWTIWKVREWIGKGEHDGYKISFVDPEKGTRKGNK